MLPRPFQMYAFFNTSNSLARGVGRYLGHQPLDSDIAKKMLWVSNLLQMSSGNAGMGKQSSIVGT